MRSKWGALNEWIVKRLNAQEKQILGPRPLSFLSRAMLKDQPGQTVYWVDAASGNNDRNTGRENSPLLTITEALERMPLMLDREFEIKVKPGTYEEQVKIAKWITSENGSLTIGGTDWEDFVLTQGIGEGSFDLGTTEIDDTPGAPDAMAAGRRLHTATLFSVNPDKVLAAGGNDDGGDPLGTAEVWHAGAWGATNAMAIARTRHVAGLVDGQVLVAGGHGVITDYLPSCELWNPTSTNWSAAGALNEGRRDAAGVVLATGDFLITGGEGSPSGVPATLDSCEIFDADTSTWALVASMAIERYQHEVVLLSDGRVLAIGGVGEESCEIYDPETDTWTATGSMADPRSRFSAALLQDGRVVVAGGMDALTVPLATSEVWDPATGAWTALAALTTDRGEHRGLVLPDGRFMVVGGISGVPTVLDSLEFWNASTEAWNASAAVLQEERHLHTLTWLPTLGAGLVAGGHDGTNTVVTSELIEFTPPTAQIVDVEGADWDPGALVGGFLHVLSGSLIDERYVIASNTDNRLELTLVDTTLLAGEEFRIETPAAMIHVDAVRGDAIQASVFTTPTDLTGVGPRFMLQDLRLRQSGGWDALSFNAAAPKLDHCHLDAFWGIFASAGSFGEMPMSQCYIGGSSRGIEDRGSALFQADGIVVASPTAYQAAAGSFGTKIWGVSTAYVSYLLGGMSFVGGSVSSRMQGLIVRSAGNGIHLSIDPATGSGGLVELITGRVGDRPLLIQAAECGILIDGPGGQALHSSNRLLLSKAEITGGTYGIKVESTHNVISIIGANIHDNSVVGVDIGNGIGASFNTLFLDAATVLGENGVGPGFGDDLKIDEVAAVSDLANFLDPMVHDGDWVEAGVFNRIVLLP